MERSRVYMCLFLVCVCGCASPGGQRAVQGGLEGLAAGTRGMLEGRAEARRAQQYQDVIIHDSMRHLGPSDKVTPIGGFLAYYWSRLSIEGVIHQLGTPDEVSILDEEITIYRWGSYVFTEKKGVRGVICLQKMK